MLRLRQSSSINPLESVHPHSTCIRYCDRRLQHCLGLHNCCNTCRSELCHPCRQAAITGSRMFATANRYVGVCDAFTAVCWRDILSTACRACASSGVSVSPAVYSAARVFRPKAPVSQQITRAYRQTVTAAAAAPQLKEVNHSEIASKVKRQLLINGKFVDAIGGKLLGAESWPYAQQLSFHAAEVHEFTSTVCCNLHALTKQLPLFQAHSILHQLQFSLCR